MITCERHLSPPALEKLRRSSCWWWIICENLTCRHRTQAALTPLIIRWGLGASSDLLRRSARCSRCGRKGMTLQHPAWVGGELGWAPFPSRSEGAVTGARGNVQGLSFSRQIDCASARDCATLPDDSHSPRSLASDNAFRDLPLQRRTPRRAVLQCPPAGGPHGDVRHMRLPVRDHHRGARAPRPTARHAGRAVGLARFSQRPLRTRR
jgi:hypothetical protein